MYWPWLGYETLDFKFFRKLSLIFEWPSLVSITKRSPILVFFWKTASISVLPSANLVLENIGFVYPFYVYDGNRPLASILRQRRCSLRYDVYWLARWWCSTGNRIKIPGIQSRIGIEYLLVNNEIESNKMIKWNTE